ncbi:MAG: hydroxyphenylacetyl-CoA thioesterase PaaI [Gammaproteobacteria bacterium]
MSSSLQGDELARACAEAMYSRDTAARDLGIVIDETGEGFARLSMTITAAMLNGHAICHGGMIFALADTAFAYACNSRNKVTVAQQCTIEFKRPGREHDRLTASAEQQSQNGRYGHYLVTVRSQDDTITAMFEGRSCEIKGTVLDTGE